MSEHPNPPELEGVNCFGIPSKYRGWRITQECDDRFYGWGPNYDADYNDEDGFVGNGECVQACPTWEALRDEIDAYIEDRSDAMLTERNKASPLSEQEGG